MIYFLCEKILDDNYLLLSHKNLKMAIYLKDCWCDVDGEQQNNLKKDESLSNEGGKN